MSYFPATVLDDGVDALVSTVDTVRLHTGDPGVTGTSNVAAGVSDVTVSLPASASASTTADVTFTIPGAATFTHVSLWAGSVFRGSDEFPTAATFSTSGTLDVSVTVTGS